MENSPPSPQQFEQADPAPSASFNLRHYWYVVLERRWIILFTFAAVLGLAGFFVYSAPKLYTASARLQIDRETEGHISLRDMVVSGSGVDQDYLQTQYKILTDPSLLEAVARKERLIEDPRYEKQMDVARALANDITVAPVRMSRLVDIKAKHTVPKRAAAIVNALAEEFIERNSNLRQDKTMTTLFFLRAEVAKLDRDVSQLEEDLHNYTSQTKFVSLDGRLNIVAEALSRSQSMYADARGRSQTAQTLVDELDHHLKQGKPAETFPSIGGDQRVGALQMQLTVLQNELASLRQRYKDKHPAVLQALSKVDEAEQAIQRTVQQLISGLQTEARVAKAQEESLKKVVSEWETQQAEWIRAKMGYDSRDQKVVIGRNLYQLAYTKLKETELMQKDRGNNIQIIHKASNPLAPSSPNVPMTLALGFAMAVACSLGLALFVNFLDDSIKNQDDVETYLRLPFLGYIPNIHANSVLERYLCASLQPQSNAAESYRSVRAAISLGGKGNHLQMITVTSTVPGEGKSVAASNLAIVMAQSGLKTLLVDADLRRPWVHRIFRVKGAASLSDFLSGKVDDTNALATPTEVANLDVVCAGSSEGLPSELISSRQMTQFLEDARRKYDRIVMDCPPISAVSDPLVLGAASDGVLYVVKFNRIRRDHARKSIQRLADAGAHFCGVILNDIDFEGRDSHYYSYYYYQNRYYAGYYPTDDDSNPDDVPRKI